VSSASFIVALTPSQVTSITFMFKLLLPLLVYSKIILTFNSVIFCPNFVIQLAQLYYDMFSDVFNQFVFILVSVIDYIKNNLIEYESKNIALEILKKELQESRDQNNQQLNSLLIENKKWRESVETYQKHLTEISTENLVQKEALNRLIIENKLLIESVKTIKTTTYIDTGVKISSIVGNALVLSLQLISLYQKITGTSEPLNNTQIRILIDSVQQLISTTNNQYVVQTATQRAAESARTNAPSAGLLSSSRPFQDEFEN
jgi:hypothetical protein